MQQLSARQHFIDQQDEKQEAPSKELRKSRRDNSDLHSSVDGAHGGPGPTRYTFSSFFQTFSFI